MWDDLYDQQQQPQQQFQPQQQPDPNLLQLLEPWTQADAVRLRRLNAGLAAAREQVEGGILSPGEGLQFQAQLVPQRAQLLQRQQAAQEAALRDQDATVMRQAALGESVEQQHDVMRAHAFPRTVAEFYDPLTGRTAHFFQGSRGNWEQVKFDGGEEGGMGMERLDQPRPTVGQTMAPNDDLAGIPEDAPPPGDIGSPFGKAAPFFDVGKAFSGSADAIRDAARAAAQPLFGKAAPLLGASGTPVAAGEPQAPPPVADEAVVRPGAEEAGPDDVALRATAAGWSPEQQMVYDQQVNDRRRAAAQARGLPTGMADLEAARAREAQAIREQARAEGRDPMAVARERAANVSKVDAEVARDFSRMLQSQEKERQKKELDAISLSPAQKKHLFDASVAYFGKPPPPGAMIHAGSRQEYLAIRAGIQRNEQARRAWMAHREEQILNRRQQVKDQAARDKAAMEFRSAEARTRVQESSLEHQRKESVRKETHEADLVKHWIDQATKDNPKMTPRQIVEAVKVKMQARDLIQGTGQGVSLEALQAEAGRRGLQGAGAAAQPAMTPQERALKIAQARGGNEAAKRQLDALGIPWRQ